MRNPAGLPLGSSWLHNFSSPFCGRPKQSRYSGGAGSQAWATRVLRNWLNCGAVHVVPLDTGGWRVGGGREDGGGACRGSSPKLPFLNGCYFLFHFTHARLSLCLIP